MFARSSTTVLSPWGRVASRMDRRWPTSQPARSEHRLRTHHHEAPSMTPPHTRFLPGPPLPPHSGYGEPRAPTMKMPPSPPSGRPGPGPVRIRPPTLHSPATTSATCCTSPEPPAPRSHRPGHHLEMRRRYRRTRHPPSRRHPDVQLRRSTPTHQPIQHTGCIVVVTRVFDGPDIERANALVGTMFAVGADPRTGDDLGQPLRQPRRHPRHNYVLWTSAQAHHTGIGNPRNPSPSPQPAWRAVHDLSAARHARTSPRRNSNPAPYPRRPCLDRCTLRRVTGAVPGER